MPIPFLPRRSDRGQVLVIFAAGLLSLLAIAAGVMAFGPLLEES